MRTIIVYGSTYGDTADAAERIADEFEARTGLMPVVSEVRQTDLSDLALYDLILVGCSTWNEGEIQDDWFDKLAEVDDLELNGKRVALFGSGDQLGYPVTFQDALGVIAARLEARGAELVGLWPTAGYEFDASLALRGHRFVGLALDYTCQIDLNEERISAWTAQLVEELGLAVEPPVAV